MAKAAAELSKSSTSIPMLIVPPETPRVAGLTGALALGPASGVATLPVVRAPDRPGTVPASPDSGDVASPWSVADSSDGTDSRVALACLLEGGTVEPHPATSATTSAAATTTPSRENRRFIAAV